MQLSEYHARRMRLGFAPPVKSPVLLPPRPRKKIEPPPDTSRAIIAQYRLVYDGAVVDRPEPPKLRITVAKIVREACEKYGCTKEELFSRRRAFSDIRAECMYRARFETRLSFPEIGRRIGGLDHSSVIAGVRRHQARIDAGTVGP